MVLNNQLSSFFQSLDTSVLISDGDGKVLFSNGFLEGAFGYRPDELAGRKVGEILPGAGLTDSIRSACEAPYVSASFIWTTGKMKNGFEFPVGINVKPYRKDGDHLALLFIVDATEEVIRKQISEANLRSIKSYNVLLEEEVKRRTEELEQANAALKKSEYLYKVMAHNFPDGVIGLLNRNMVYILVDGWDLHDPGTDGNKVVGERLFEEVNSIIAAHAGSDFEEVWRGHKVSFDVEFNTRYYNVTAVPVFAESEDINEILVVVKNITTQRHLENNLLATLRKEKELNVLKSRLVTLASHEFRTPLTTIKSSVYLLEKYLGGELDDVRKKHIDRILRSVHILTEFLNEFLSLGRLDEGKVRLEYQECNMMEFLEELMQDLKVIKKKDQEIAFKCTGCDGKAVLELSIFRNILLNLVSNAIKYSSADGRIEIMVKLADGTIEISVKDEGIGILDEDKDHIFERFYRGSNATHFQGTGLGLNIVKKYVELLNGEIHFESVANGGTTFKVSFPLGKKQAVKV